MTTTCTTTEFPQHIPSIPYTDPSGRLQTLDIWLPRPLEQSDPSTTLWIIYIHGGAWRDPTQNSLCILPALTHLSSPTYASTLPHIAGIASLNYRLSPYDNHPTDPSSPSDTQRNATHPQHVQDVRTGLAWLAREYGVRRWIGVGHSCGASLLLQVVGGIGIPSAQGEEEEEEKEEKEEKEVGGVRRTKAPPGPISLILLEGIYNIPLLLRNHSPPSTPEPISRIYTSLVTGAFGPHASLYASASPVSGAFGPAVWPEGKLVILAHSYEDELVERAQRDVMVVKMDREGWSVVVEERDEGDVVREGRRVLNVRDVRGAHDWVWEDGAQIAGLVGEIVGRLVA